MRPLRKPSNAPDLPELLASFVVKHAPILTHQAGYLEMAEAGAKERREGNEPEASLPPEGLYQRQATQLRDITATLKAAHAANGAIATGTLDERMALQKQFASAIGVLNMAITEHAQVNKSLARRTSPERLENKYRKRHYIPDSDELEPEASKKIRIVARNNQAALADAAELTLSIIDARDALQDIREAVFPSAPRRSGGDNGQKM